MPYSGISCPVDLVRTDVSEEPSASIIRVARLTEVGTIVVTSNRCSLRSSGWMREKQAVESRKLRSHLNVNSKRISTLQKTHSDVTKDNQMILGNY
jgi:hypothetical protein